MGVQRIMDVITKAQRALAIKDGIANDGEPDALKGARPVRGDGMVETHRW